MKQSFPILFLLAALIFSCEPAPVVEDTTEDIPDAATAEAAVEQLIQDAFDEVWSNLDTSALARFHTDDFLLLEHGEVWTNDTIRNYQLRAQPRAAEEGHTRNNDFEFLETVADGKTVWTAYHNYGTWTKDEEVLFKLHWLESAVAVYTEEGWKLVMLHSTRVPMPESAEE